jgi:hypothetical protein
MNKEFILSNVRRATVEQLVEAITTNVVTFEELRETGGFIRPKQEAVKELLDARAAKIREEQKEIEAREYKEEQAWTVAKDENTVQSYKYYQSLYPNGKYYDNADRKIYQIQEEVNSKKYGIIDDIKTNSHEYSAYRIKDLFDKGSLTKNDLIDSGIITKDALKIFLNPPIFQTDMNTWGDLAPLKADRTDVYFFGILGSGKSCLLGGMLYYANKGGHLELTGNGKGIKYGNSLIRTTKIGYVPPSTPISGANYIEAVLTNSDNIEHPVNIIEMSGEMLSRTYEYETTKNVERNGVVLSTIGSNEFLHNDNKKIIFFILDYKETIDPFVTKNIADQSAQLEYALTSLNDDGTLSKTAAIYIVLTKSDLLPGGADDLTQAKRFIEEEYLNLWRNTKRYGEKHRYSVKILTYSLGEFMLGSTFNYDSKYSENIYNAIIASSFVEKKKKGFLGLGK